MPTTRQIGEDDWEVLRDLRLRALADSPDAFGSTLEREAAFTEADWRQRASGHVVVVEDPEPVGMAGTFDNDGVPHVWGMWVDPAHRGHGHTRRLLDALLPYGGPAVLDVNVANDVARVAYERYGFVGTGELEPLRPGSEQRIELMRLPG